MQRFIILALISQLLLSCGIYSFSGTSIKPDVTTISVYNIENVAIRVNPSLSNTLTEALKEKYRRFTKLTQQTDGGDLMLEGQITSYETASMAVTANEMPSMTRLTVTVKIIFTDQKYPENSFEKNFVAYEDFNATESFDSKESDLVEAIVEKLVEDIFNGTVANW